MRILKDLIEYAENNLPLNKFPERKEEYLRILQDVLNIQKYQINLILNQEISQKTINQFVSLINERKTGKPLAYILGYTYFYQDKFPVSTKTLIPRYDTEHLIEAIRTSFHKDENINILDIGTGTGVIALSLFRIFPYAYILGIDIEDEPFKNSCKYLKINNPNISIKKKDFLNKKLWIKDIDLKEQKWDCIVSNPPYLNNYDMDVLDRMVKEYEPHTALFGGEDGLIFYRMINEYAIEYLKSDGLLVLEIDYKYKQISSIFSQENFISRKIINDYNNLPRVLVLRKK